MDITEHLTTFLSSTQNPEDAAAQLITKLGGNHVLFDLVVSTPILSYTDEQLESLAEFMSITNDSTMTNDIDEIGNFDEVVDDDGNDNEQQDENINLTANQTQSLINNIREEQLLLNEILLKVGEKLFPTKIGHQMILNHHHFLLLLSGHNTYFRKIITDDDTTNNSINNDNDNNNITHTVTSTPLPTQHPTTLMFLSTFFNTTTPSIDMIGPTNEETTTNNTSNNTNSTQPTTISHSPTVQTLIKYIFIEYEHILNNNIQILLSTTLSVDEKLQQITSIPISLQSTLITLLQGIDIDIDRISTLLSLYTIYSLLFNLITQLATQNQQLNILSNTIFDSQQSLPFLKMYLSLDSLQHDISTTSHFDPEHDDLSNRPFILSTLTSIAPKTTTSSTTMTDDDNNNNNNNTIIPPLSNYQCLTQQIHDFSTIYTRTLTVLFKLIENCGLLYDRISFTPSKLKFNIYDSTLLSKMTYFIFTSLNSLHLIDKVKNILIFPQISTFIQSIEHHYQYQQLSTKSKPKSTNPFDDEDDDNNTNTTTNNEPKLPDIVLSLSISELLTVTLTTTKLGLYYLQSTGLISDLIFSIFANMKILTPVTHIPNQNQRDVQTIGVLKEFKDGINTTAAKTTTTTTPTSTTQIIPYKHIDIYSTFLDYFNSETHTFFDDEDQSFLYQYWCHSQSQSLHNLSTFGTQTLYSFHQKENNTNSFKHQQQLSHLTPKQIELRDLEYIGEFILYINTTFKFLTVLFERAIEANIDIHLFFLPSVHNYFYLKPYIQQRLSQLQEFYDKDFTFMHFNLISLCLDAFTNSISLDDIIPKLEQSMQIGFGDQTLLSQLNYNELNELLIFKSIFNMIQQGRGSNPYTQQNDTNMNDTNNDDEQQTIELNRDLIWSYLATKQHSSHFYPIYLLPYVFIRGLTLSLRFQGLFTSSSMLLGQFARQSFIETIYPQQIYLKSFHTQFSTSLSTLQSLPFHDGFKNMLQIILPQFKSTHTEQDIFHESITIPISSFDIAFLLRVPYYQHIITHILTTSFPLQHEQLKQQQPILPIHSNLLFWSPIASLICQYSNYDTDVQSHVLHVLANIITPSTLTIEHNSILDKPNTEPQSTPKRITSSNIINNKLNYVYFKAKNQQVEDNNGQVNSFLLKSLGFPSISTVQTTTKTHSSLTALNTNPQPTSSTTTFLNTYNIITYLQIFALTMIINPNRLTSKSFSSSMPLMYDSTTQQIMISPVFNQLNEIQFGMFCDCGYNYHFSNLLEDVAYLNDMQDNEDTSKYGINLFSKSQLQTMHTKRHLFSKSNSLLQTISTTFPLLIDELTSLSSSVIESVQFSSLHLLSTLSSSISYGYPITTQSSPATTKMVLNHSISFPQYQLMQSLTLLQRLSDEDLLSSNETTKLLYDWKRLIAQKLIFTQSGENGKVTTNGIEIIDLTSTSTTTAESNDSNNLTTLSQFQSKHTTWFTTHIQHSLQSSHDLNWNNLLITSSQPFITTTVNPQDSTSISKPIDVNTMSDAEKREYFLKINQSGGGNDEDDEYGGYYSKHDEQSQQQSQQQQQPTNQSDSPNQQFIQPTVTQCPYYRITHPLHKSSSDLVGNFELQLQNVEKLSRTLHQLPPQRDTKIEADVGQ